MARVDVRIPVMGRATYLPAAIESVLEQSFRDLSLLVSENGMPDPVIASTVLPFLSDARVQHLSVGEVISAAAHHTRLIASGDAPYVAVLHDDDRWYPDALRERVAFLDAHPECGFVFSGARIVDDHGNELTTALPDLAEGVQERSAFVPFLYGGNVVHVSSTLLRRSALEAVGSWFDEEFAVYDDHELWFRLAVRFPAGYLRRCDVDIRRHAAQRSLALRLRGEEHLRLLGRFDELLADRMPGAVPPGTRRLVRAQVLLTCALDEIQRGNPRQARTRVAEAVRERPGSLIGAKGVAASLGAVGGGAGRRAIGVLREREERRRPYP